MLPLLGAIPALIKTGVDGFFKWKDGETKKEISLQDFELAKERLAADIELKMMEELRKPNNDFRKFVLDYEGKASDMHPAVQFIRSSVRPAITYWALIIITCIMFGWVNTTELTANMAAIPKPLWTIFELIFGFWFGGRAATQAITAYQEGKAKIERDAGAQRVEEAKENRIAIQAKNATPKKKSSNEEEEDDDGWFNW